MCDFDNEIHTKIFKFTNYFLFLILAVIHLVYYFFIKETDFNNLFNTYESSPLFEFNIDSNCGNKSHVTFHIWGGRQEVYYRGRKKITKIVDKAEISRINGNYFCYKHISYKESLHNGQIIKKGETCPGNYNKNCGTIDTLEQQLCIKNGDNCPLYDVGIGDQTDTNNYTQHISSNTYYNNDNYQGPKTIIGKLILNDGQPCYQINEKLWRKFKSNEVDKEHLDCDLEIFGKLNDDRYEKRGDITYKKIYEDNLPLTSQELLLDNIKDEKTFLYKRVFLGIDKSCDEKADINEDKYDKLRKSQNMEKVLLLVESILIISFLISFFITTIILSIKYKLKIIDIFIFLIFMVILLFICIICQSVFIARMANFDFYYNCSDEITN